jgi:F0F1-type ATP synthase epsilon subunit
MALTLDIVSPRGLVASEKRLDRIVVRRREPAHEPGSEIAILPHHGPLLMQTQACGVRVLRGDEERVLDVGAGVLEVLDDHVTIVLT